MNSIPCATTYFQKTQIPFSTCTTFFQISQFLYPNNHLDKYTQDNFMEENIYLLKENWP